MNNQIDIHSLPLDHDLVVEYERFLADVWQDAQIANGFDPESAEFYENVQAAFWSYREVGYW